MNTVLAEVAEKIAFGQTLRDIRNLYGYTQVDVAQKTGLSQSYVNKLEKGLVNYDRVSRGVVSSVMEAYNLRPEAWDIILEGKLTYEQIPQFLKDYSRDAIPQQRIPEPTGQIIKGQWFPVYGIVSAGMPLASEDNRIGDIFVEDSDIRPNALAVETKGSSMTPTIQSGDRVLIDLSDKELLEGKVYVVCCDNDGYVVKRAKKRNGEWWLISDNPEYFPFRPNEATITGRVYKVYTKPVDI